MYQRRLSLAEVEVSGNRICPAGLVEGSRSVLTNILIVGREDPCATQIIRSGTVWSSGGA